MSLSIHLISDNCPPTQIDRALLFLGRAHPSHAVIGGGAAFDVTMQTVERARAIAPNTAIIVRKLEDTGVWTRLNPQQWFDDRVSPRLDWCQKNKVIWLLDNETSGNDDTIRRYAAWNVDVMKRLHMVGLHAAVGAFATGTIGDGEGGSVNQFPLFKPVFDALQPGDVYAPHEYVNAPGRSSSGHVYRYSKAWAAAGRSLPTVITETGMAVDYNPGMGFRAHGMNGKSYASYLISFDKQWYQPYGVTACIFAIGGYTWPTFQLDGDVLTELENYAASLPKPVPAPPPPVIQPPPVTTPPAQTSSVTITIVGLTSEQAQTVAKSIVIKIG